jgi:hypothetical protein
MMAVTYITLQLRKPSRDGGDPGEVAETWFSCDGDVVQLTDRDGHPLPGDENRRRLKNSETAREAAVQLLRSKTWPGRAGRSIAF